MFRDVPIARKLMLAILATSGVALLLAGGAIIAYDVFSYRRGIITHVDTLGNVVAGNSTAALAFHNQQDANAILAALRAEPQIRVAALYDAGGELFAAWPPQVDPVLLPEALIADGHRFENRHLASFHPVVEAGSATLGTLYLRADLTSVYDRLWFYGRIVLGFLVLAAGIAYLVARRLQRSISEPIVALAGTARTISEEQDYTVRAAPARLPELRTLTDTFNRMLSRIDDDRERQLSQLKRLDLLQRITRAIGERQDLPSIFQVVVSSLETDMPLDLCCVCSHVPDEKHLVVVAVGAGNPALAERLGLVPKAVVPLGANGLARCVEGRIVYEPDVSAHAAGLLQRMSAEGLHSLVAAPLCIERRVWGVLIAMRRGAGDISSRDCEFLGQLSDHVGLAVHQVELYDALRQAYDDLRESQFTIAQQERLRALGQMASGIAHDINNALAPVSLYTEALLESEPGLTPAGRGYLGTIQRAIDDVGQTVARMREFYRRPEASQAPARMNLNSIIEQVVDLTRARWSNEPQAKGIVITLVKELAPRPVVAMGMEAEVRDALVNLVFNAVDAMPGGGTLTIRTRTVPGIAGGESQALVEVSDTGVGMDDATRRRCFEPFFTTKGERGTGLGLAMVYGMIQRHQGQVELDSVPNQGTTVRLVFPAARPEAGAAVEPARPVQSARRLRLLVVDDDPLLIQSLRDILESERHQVTVAPGGQAGIDAFVDAQRLQQPFDAVITDLGMPHLDGRAVAAAVKALSPETPVILLTGWGHRLMAENDVPPHVDHVISKPPKLRQLRDVLAHVAAEGAGAGAPGTGTNTAVPG